MFDEDGDLWHFRDLLFEMNDAIINHERAKMYAEKVKDRNPEAKWVIEVLCPPTRGYTSLPREFDSDARAIVYHCLLQYGFPAAVAYQPTLLMQAAEMGHALAQAAVSYIRGPDAIKWARKSAAQGEREGYHRLAQLMNNDLNLHREAALRGHVHSSHTYGLSLPLDDPHRWDFLGVWWPENCTTELFDGGAEFVVERFKNNLDDTLRRSVFKIGHVVAMARWKRGVPFHKHAWVSEYYKRGCQRTKEAVNGWLLVGRRARVVKDVRKLIGIMIWKTRFEGLFN